MQLRASRIERWYEESASKTEIDISESGVGAIDLGQLLGLCGEGSDKLPRAPLDYGESQGSPVLRERLASLYDTSSRSVLITAGASEALFVALSATTTPKGNVVLEWPFFKPMDRVIEFLGGNSRWWRLLETSDYVPDIEALSALADSNTAAIVINHPHNPTGSLLDSGQWKQLLIVARRSGAIVISDEVAGELVIGDSSPITSAVNFTDHALSIGSFSKAYGLPGLRIGWIVGEQKLIQRCKTIKEHLSAYPSSVCQHLALLVLRSRRSLLGRNLLRLNKNVGLVNEWIDRHSEWYYWVKPKGGACGFVGYRFRIRSYSLCKRILKETGVLLTPGSVFGVEYHFRLGFGGDTTELLNGLARLEEFTAALSTKETHT